MAGVRRDKVLNLRLASESHERWLEAAVAGGVSLSVWVRGVCDRAAAASPGESVSKPDVTRCSRCGEQFSVGFSGCASDVDGRGGFHHFPGCPSEAGALTGRDPVGERKLSSAQGKVEARASAAHPAASRPVSAPPVVPTVLGPVVPAVARVKPADCRRARFHRPGTWCRFCGYGGD